MAGASFNARLPGGQGAASSCAAAQASFDFGPRRAGVEIGVIGGLSFVEEPFFTGGGAGGFLHLPRPGEDVAAVFRCELGQFGEDFGFAHVMKVNGTLQGSSQRMAAFLEN